jgi:hypothetical protein
LAEKPIRKIHLKPLPALLPHPQVPAALAVLAIHIKSIRLKIISPACFLAIYK